MNTIAVLRCGAELRKVASERRAVAIKSHATGGSSEGSSACCHFTSLKKAIRKVNA